MSVSPETMLWIVRQGSRFLKFEQSKTKRSTKGTCAVCETSHDREEDMRIFGPLYHQWLMCSRCDCWVGPTCLGICQAQFDRVISEKFQPWRCQRAECNALALDDSYVSPVYMREWRDELSRISQEKAIRLRRMRAATPYNTI